VGRRAQRHGRRIGLDMFKLSFREQFQVLTQILKHLRTVAESSLQQNLSEAVIATPAAFSSQDLHTVVEAGKLAGFAVVKTVSQPIATVLASFQDDTRESRRILVCDFGGMKSEATVIQNVHQILAILSNACNQRLGGRHLDERLAAWMKERLDFHPADQTWDTAFRQQLVGFAERAKVALSAAQSYALNEVVTSPLGRVQHVSLKIERGQFEALIEQPVEQMFGLCKDAVDQSGLQLMDIDDVVITGGSSRIPLVAHRLEQEFGLKTRLIEPEAVAVGAAMVAQQGSLGREYASVPQKEQSETGPAAYIEWIRNPSESHFEQEVYEASLLIEGVERYWPQVSRMHREEIEKLRRDAAKARLQSDSVMWSSSSERLHSLVQSFHNLLDFLRDPRLRDPGMLTNMLQLLRQIRKDCETPALFKQASNIGHLIEQIDQQAPDAPAKVLEALSALEFLRNQIERTKSASRADGIMAESPAPTPAQAHAPAASAREQDIARVLEKDTYLLTQDVAVRRQFAEPDSDREARPHTQYVFFRQAQPILRVPSLWSRWQYTPSRRSPWVAPCRDEPCQMSKT